MNTNVKGNNFPELEGMSSYIGTKISGAKPMNRQEYNDFRGWDLPADEEGSDAGYIVQYTDGYVSWSPASQFEEAYRKTEGMNFGLAIEAMKKGMKVQRKGWNGKSINIFLVDRSIGIIEKDDSDFTMQEHIVIDTTGLQTDNEAAPKSIVPWLASQTDMLADDWQVAA